MSNSQLAPLHVDNESGHQGENNNIAPGNVGPPAGPVGISIADPIDVNSHVAIDVNLPTYPENIIRGTQYSELGGFTLTEAESDRIPRRYLGGCISANIIRSKVVEQLGLRDKTVPAVRILNGFNMACETTKGEITLPVNITGTIRDAKFYVIKGDMRYNALHGMPWIHNMRVMPSTLHQVLKFPTPEGIKTVYGEQPAAKEKFAIEEVIPISVLTTSKETNSGANQKAK
uniref:Uncharacterized protein n=1 Tax=Nicotiana tabacum TaxID=4097 RepID=A0A1S4DGR1_TOBAC|nr:PREDICTED: uncharacterized protein LOC107829504 [Nicotiana tabacum]